MRVLYDITTLAHIHCAEGVSGAGIFRHVEETGLALARHNDVDFRLSTAAAQHTKAIRYLAEAKHFPLDRFATPALGADCGVSQLLGPLGSPTLEGGRLNTKFIAHLASTYSPERICASGDIDVYHVNWRGESTLPSRSQPLVAVTIPDIIALKHPEWFVKSGEPNGIGDYLTRLLDSVRPAHIVITSTESVKNDIIQFFPHIDADQIHVVPLGVSSSFERIEDPNVLQSVRRKYAIPDDRRYVLCLNTLEPRKNMATAIEAFGRLAGEQSVEDVTLVLAGTK
nr:hypothetical protein [Ilumatobacter sp.]